MTTTTHLCISIRWLLKHNDKYLKGVFKERRGKPALTPSQAREYLYDRLGEGKNVLPFGEPCEGFSYINGCPGHENEENENK